MALTASIPPSPVNQLDATRRSPKQRPIIAVIGNPNTGKTTLFNALTGLTQHTGNYPGVTVESAMGEFTVAGERFLAVDLPGTYSLAPRAPDEMLAVSILLGYGKDIPTPDAVLFVLDASNLDRNLYLLTQVIETGRPVVVALTMVDLAQKQGIIIDYEALGKRLGVPVIPVHAVRRIGLATLQQALQQVIKNPSPSTPCIHFPAEFSREIEALTETLPPLNGSPSISRFLATRLLIDAEGSIERDLSTRFGESLMQATRASRERLTRAGTPVPQIETNVRYQWIAETVATTVRQPLTANPTWTDRIDTIVTHKVWGLVVFLVAMALTFQSIFSWAAPLMDAIDTFFQAAGAYVGNLLADGPLRSLIVDGLIGGVGAVVVFVPQIAILFGLIAILEDSGYMARAAFLMDRVMASFGLSGRSFIPLLSSFACAVPGIMSTRSIDNHRDRIATILIAPLMSCSARLPVYVLLISAFIPNHTLWGIVGLQGVTLFVLYCLGLIVAPPIALLLKQTVLRGESVPFLLELPPFKVPAWRVVLFRMYDRSLAFLRRAGTIILATTIVVWALSYYPRHASTTLAFQEKHAAATTEEEHAQISTEEAGIHLRESYLGQAGHFIEPLVRPLGWDWKIGMATLASFPAREVIIAALGTIYNLGNEQDESSTELRSAMRAERWPDGRPVYTPVVALSIMVFFALCCQCGATLATIKRETNSWGYAGFTFLYMTGLAYLSALVVYQVGSRIWG
ncbi:MAG: ferrous iron transport protein B [Candidatus Binatia bacterium]